MCGILHGVGKGKELPVRVERRGHQLGDGNTRKCGRLSPHDGQALVRIAVRAVVGDGRDSILANAIVRQEYRDQIGPAAPGA